MVINRRPKYSFDEKGFYKKNRLLFDWHCVSGMTTSFKEHSAHVNLFAGDSDALMSGGPFQRVDYFSYGAAISFALSDGTTIKIPTDLDSMGRTGLFENIHDASTRANPHIRFE